MEHETVIGLEVHVQLNTATKLFCSCPVAFGREPNTLTCPVCTGQPGVLPVLNGQALRHAVTAGLALNAAIAAGTRFDRKNYFYPDLPKGYQITQFALPIATEGHLEIEEPGGGPRRIGITRIHLEEDAGKTIHRDDQDLSLVDLNRAGVPLLEIVTEPVIASPREAHAFLAALKLLMQYAGVSDCEMEKGSLRCDANVSIRPRGGAGLGARRELKNLNSFRNVEKALAHEEKRQREIVAGGGTVRQETLLWRESEGVTAPMRTKEESRDYRYFPEPDLPPFDVPAALVEELRAGLPESPLARKRRFESAFGLSPRDAGVLTAERKVADFFEACAGACGDPGEAAKWIQGPVLQEMNSRGTDIDGVNLTPDRIAGIVALVRAGKVSRQAARKVIARMAETGTDAEAAVAELGLGQVSDSTALDALVDSVIAESAGMADEYRRGKDATLNALLGRVMKASGGRADPAAARALLEKKLSG